MFSFQQKVWCFSGLCILVLFVFYLHIVLFFDPLTRHRPSTFGHQEEKVWALHLSLLYMKLIQGWLKTFGAVLVFTIWGSVNCKKFNWLEWRDHFHISVAPQDTLNNNKKYNNCRPTHPVLKSLTINGRL